MPRRVLVLVLSAALSAGCAARTGGPQLTVFAAASLQDAFSRYGGQFGGASVRYSFAGSDALAAQIERGLRPDVFAAANTAYPQELYARGLLQRPVVFASNRLVLAVPASSSIATLAQAQRPGVKLALGQASVPVGAYARALIARMALAQSRAIMANVSDSEPDVSGIVGKLTQGAVDAGFVYASDVASADGRLRAVELPARLQPRVAYAIAVVRGSPHAAQARRFIAGLLLGAGRRDLAADGFARAGGA